MAGMAIHITGDEHADQVLTDSPFALLCGMLLDQQFPMERAFAGPAKVLDRFGSLEPAQIAAAEPEQFASLRAEPPAVHRFPGSMAERIQTVARIVVEEYDGHAERIWTEATDADDLMKRMTSCPGSAGRSPRSSSPCWPSSSAYARKGGVRRRRLQPGGLPIGRRRGGRGVAGEGARVQEGEEGGRKGSVHLTCRFSRSRPLQSAESPQGDSGQHP